MVRLGGSSPVFAVPNYQHSARAESGHIRFSCGWAGGSTLFNLKALVCYEEDSSVVGRESWCKVGRVY